MEPVKENHKKLFDELLKVLNKHRSEEGAISALGYLKAAQDNYLQGSTDHMLSSLVLAWAQVGKLSPEALGELHAVIRTFVASIFAAAAEMTRLAGEYEAAGGKALSREEIEDEVNARRGAS